MTNSIKRQQIIYKILSWGTKKTLEDLKDCLKLEGIDSSIEEIVKDFEQMTPFQIILKTDSNPPVFYIEIDDFRDMNESIDYLLKLENPAGGFKALDFLISLRNKEIRDFKREIRTLIEQLLKFDYSRDSHLQKSWYFVAVNYADKIKDIIEDSPSVVSMLEPEQECYAWAREIAANDAGINIDFIPIKNPYNLLNIVLNKHHPLFRFDKDIEDK